MNNNSKKILIYGVNGFVGKNLIIELIKSNYDVYAISSSNKIDITNNDRKYFKKCKFIKINRLKNIDINIALLNSSPNNKEKKNVTFLKSINEYKKILSNLNKNVVLVYLSSGIVCFNTNFDRGNSLYRSYKKKMEKIVIQNAIKNNKTYKIMRLFSIYGPYMPLQKYAIGLLISSINEKKIFSFHSDGNFFRDYVFVKDLVKIIKIEIKTPRSITIDISSKKINFKHLCKNFCKFNNIKNFTSFGKNKDSLQNYYLDNKNFKNTYPKFNFTSLNKSLLSTINWFKKAEYRNFKINYEK